MQRGFERLIEAGLSDAGDFKSHLKLGLGKKKRKTGPKTLGEEKGWGGKVKPKAGPYPAWH